MLLRDLSPELKLGLGLIALLVGGLLSYQAVRELLQRRRLRASMQKFAKAFVEEYSRLRLVQPPEVEVSPFPKTLTALITGITLQEARPLSLTKDGEDSRQVPRAKLLINPRFFSFGWSIDEGIRKLLSTLLRECLRYEIYVKVPEAYAKGGRLLLEGPLEQIEAKIAEIIDALLSRSDTRRLIVKAVEFTSEDIARAVARDLITLVSPLLDEAVDYAITITKLRKGNEKFSGMV